MDASKGADTGSLWLNVGDVMISSRNTFRPLLLALAASIVAAPAFAASDVSTSSATSNAVVGSVAGSVASGQASSIISSAATGGFTASGTGGFTASGTGGFNASGSGGFNGGTGGGGGGGAGGSVAPDGGAAPSGKPTSFNFHSDNGKSGGDEASKISIWGQAVWANVNKSETALVMNGNVYNMMGGIDRRLSTKLVTGLAVGFEDVEMITKFNNGTYRDRGITVAPYMGWTLNPDWTLDGSASYTFLDYDSARNNGAVHGNFDGARWGASSNLTGSFAKGNWRYQPRANASYTVELQNSYKDNLSTVVDANRFANGELSGGGKVGYDFGVPITPYFKGMAQWNFVRPDAVIKSNGDKSLVYDYSGVAGLGGEYSKDGATASLEVDYNSLFERELDVWVLIARARWQF